MNKLFVQVERVEDLMGRADNYFTPPEAKERKPITNADRIRSMTDEELAEWLFHHSMVCAPGKRPTPGDCIGGCGHCWLDWLKQEVDA